MMTDPLAENFISSAKKQFKYYKFLGEKTFEQLDEKDFHWRRNEETNSIATIVYHLRGNMLSRWTDFLSSDGEKEWRQRDKEFLPVNSNRINVLKFWEEGWTVLFSTLAGLNKGNIDQVIYIRNEGHSIVEAVNRQLCHYAYHVGQIVHIAKSIQGDNWKSLSVPIGQSEDYNKMKFKQEKSIKHFTEDNLDE